MSQKRYQHQMVKEGGNMNKTETYRTTTIKVGNCTINIYHPILTEKERLEREEMVKTALANFGRALEGMKC